VYDTPGLQAMVWEPNVSFPNRAATPGVGEFAFEQLYVVSALVAANCFSSLVELQKRRSMNTSDS